MYVCSIIWIYNVFSLFYPRRDTENSEVFYDKDNKNNALDLVLFEKNKKQKKKTKRTVMYLLTVKTFVYCTDVEG